MSIGSKLSITVLDTREMALSSQQLTCILETLGHLTFTDAKMKTTREINVQQGGMQ